MNAKQLFKKSTNLSNTLRFDTRALIVSSFTGITLVLLVILSFSSCEPQKMAKLSGSIILQVQQTDSAGKVKYDFYEMTDDSLKGLLVSKTEKYPFSRINGPILAYSQNRKFIVFRTDSADKGSNYQLLNVDSGKTSIIESCLYVNNFDFRFSPDSRWLAYTNDYRLIVYDCSENRKFCIKEPSSATYFGINGLTFGFVGDIVWKTSNNICYKYRSKMPESYSIYSNNGPNYPDSYEISTPQGKRLEGGTLRSSDSSGVSSAENDNEETDTSFMDEGCFIAGHYLNLSKEYPLNDPSGVTFKFLSPDNKHMINICDTYSKANWFWIDIKSKQSTLLGIDLGLNYSDDIEWFWSQNYSFLFLLYNSHTIFAIPISKDLPLWFDFDSVPGLQTGHYQIVFGCYIN
jgi:hypothetical protein